MSQSNAAPATVTTIARAITPPPEEVVYGPQLPPPGWIGLLDGLPLSAVPIRFQSCVQAGGLPDARDVQDFVAWCLHQGKPLLFAAVANLLDADPSLVEPVSLGLSNEAQADALVAAAPHCASLRKFRLRCRLEGDGALQAPALERIAALVQGGHGLRHFAIMNFSAAGKPLLESLATVPHLHLSLRSGRRLHRDERALLAAFLASACELEDLSLCSDLKRLSPTMEEAVNGLAVRLGVRSLTCRGWGLGGALKLAAAEGSALTKLRLDVHTRGLADVVQALAGCTAPIEEFALTCLDREARREDGDLVPDALAQWAGLSQVLLANLPCGQQKVIDLLSRPGMRSVYIDGPDPAAPDDGGAALVKAVRLNPQLRAVTIKDAFRLDAGIQEEIDAITSTHGRRELLLVSGFAGGGLCGLHPSLPADLCQAWADGMTPFMLHQTRNTAFVNRAAYAAATAGWLTWLHRCIERGDVAQAAALLEVLLAFECMEQGNAFARAAALPHFAEVVAALIVRQARRSEDAAAASLQRLTRLLAGAPVGWRAVLDKSAVTTNVMARMSRRAVRRPGDRAMGQAVFGLAAQLESANPSPQPPGHVAAEALHTRVEEVVRQVTHLAALGQVDDARRLLETLEQLSSIMSVEAMGWVWVGAARALTLSAANWPLADAALRKLNAICEFAGNLDGSEIDDLLVEAPPLRGAIRELRDVEIQRVVAGLLHGDAQAAGSAFVERAVARASYDEAGAVQAIQRFAGHSRIPAADKALWLATLACALAEGGPPNNYVAHYACSAAAGWLPVDASAALRERVRHALREVSQKVGAEFAKPPEKPTQH